MIDCFSRLQVPSQIVVRNVKVNKNNVKKNEVSCLSRLVGRKFWGLCYLNTVLQYKHTKFVHNKNNYCEHKTHKLFAYCKSLNILEYFVIVILPSI